MKVKYFVDQLADGGKIDPDFNILHSRIECHAICPKQCKNYLMTGSIVEDEGGRRLLIVRVF